MRLSTDEELEAMMHNGIYFKATHLNDSVPYNEIRDKIKKATRRQCLLFWHDHAAILGRGYLLITVSVVCVIVPFFSANESLQSLNKSMLLDCRRHL